MASIMLEDVIYSISPTEHHGPFVLMCRGEKKC